MAWADYIFVWDKKEQKVVRAYYVHYEGMPEKDIPDDAFSGAIEEDDEEYFVNEVLEKKFPDDRYFIGGGIGSSLEEILLDHPDIEREHDDDNE